MNTNIQWQAPMSKISFVKILISIILVPIIYFAEKFLGIQSVGIAHVIFIVVMIYILGKIYKKWDPHANNNIQLFLYRKFIANYRIEPNNLIIKIGKKEKVIYFNKIIFFTTICPETSRFHSSPGFNILYLVLGENNYKKYIPIFVPNLMREDIIKKLSEYIKFYDKKEAKQKIKSNLIKYFGLLLISGILLFFILFAIYQTRCSTYTSPVKDNSTFWNAVKTCNLL